VPALSGLRHTSLTGPMYFMYRRPILCTLYGAVDFLNVLKKGCCWGGGGEEVLVRNVLHYYVPRHKNNRYINSYYFLSSLPLLRATTAVFGSYLSSLYSYPSLSCIAGAGLPNHMMGEVSWDTYRRQSWAS
jgi:hypothetical protein